MSTSNKTDSKRSRFNIIHNVTWLMCKGMPNVTAGESLEQHPPRSEPLLEILYNAALEHRDWNFVIMTANKFDINAGTERLAMVEMSYSKRAGEVIPHLNADRLPSRRSGGTVFSHKETAPILRKMREHVYPRTSEEILTSATGHVSSALYTITTTHNQTLSDANTALTTAALAFAFDPMYKAQFFQFEATHGKAANRDTAAHITLREQTTEQQRALKAYKNGAGTTCAIVAHTNGRWYVQYESATAHFDTDELPEKFSNVHVLKLVEKYTVIVDVGVKVDDNTFIITVQNS